MKASFINLFRYLIYITIGGVFVWLSVKDIQYEQWVQIKDAVARARHWLIIPVVLLLMLSHYSRTLRWKLLMEPLGYRPSTFNTFAAVMIGYLVNAGVPRLGEVVKCTILARYEKVRADKLVGTIVLERALDLVCLGVVFLIALITQWHIIGDAILRAYHNFFDDRSGNVSITKILIAAGAFILFLLILYFTLRRFAHINAVAKIREVIRGVLHGLNSIRLVKHKGWFLFHTVLIWVLYLASTTLGIYALRETDHLGLAGGITTLAVGSVGIIIAPGGIGAYAYLVAKLMKLYGIDEETIGNALGWLLWTVQTLMILAGGLIFFGLLSHYNKKRHIESRQKHH